MSDTEKIAGTGENERLDIARGGMTVTQVCDFSAIKRTFVYELTDQGRLKYARIGRRRIILRASAEQLLSEGLVAGRH